MAGVTNQQTIQTNDGTDITIESWLREEDTVIMQPGDTRFTGICPEHGEIKSSYVSMLVGFAVDHHADEHHGGLRSPEDLLEIGPAIDLRMN